MLHWLQISDEYIAPIIQKCGCSVIALQSLIYNNEITLDECEYFFNKHIASKGMFIRAYKYSIRDIYNYKRICIFRDPLKRFISGVRTTLYFKPYYKTPDNILEHIIKNGVHSIDVHTYPQSSLYNFDDIDLFINIDDYPKFCKEHNIKWFMANKNTNEEYLNYKPSKQIIDIVKELYKDDYKLIDRIKTSGKLYIPNT